jgi:hypothetical protein
MRQTLSQRLKDDERMVKTVLTESFLVNGVLLGSLVFLVVIAVGLVLVR